MSQRTVTLISVLSVSVGKRVGNVVIFSALSGLLCIACLCQSRSVLAEPSKAEYGVVLNLSGKQRMLTQKMTKEMLLVAYGYEADENLAQLKATAGLFDKTLKGLKEGDADLGLPPTEEPRILRQLRKVDAQWAPYHKTVKSVLDAKSVSGVALKEAADLNLSLLKNMNKAVLLYERDAKKDQLKNSSGLATAINLAGKQRMLTQKMSKEFLLVALGHDVQGNKLNLLETSSLFDRTLKGLKSGDDVLGLSPTQSSEILAQLEKVEALWREFKPLMDRASSPEAVDLSREDVQKMAKANIPLLKEMNAAVKMYEQLAQ